MYYYSHSIFVILNLVLSIIILGPIVIANSFFGNNNNLICKIWAHWMNKVLFLNYEVVDIDKVDFNKKYLFLANHASAVDIPLMIATIPSYLCFLAKKELFSIPFFGSIIKSIGVIQVDRYNKKRSRESVVDAVSVYEKQKESIIIFPEGTRSRDGSLNVFKKGGFYLAIKTKLPVLPIAIINANKVLKKKSFRIKYNNKIKIIFNKPINTQGYEENSNDVEDLKNKVWHIINDNLNDYKYN